MFLSVIYPFNRLAQRIVQGDVPQALMNRKVHICLNDIFLPSPENMPLSHSHEGWDV